MLVAAPTPQQDGAPRVNQGRQGEVRVPLPRRRLHQHGEEENQELPDAEAELGDEQFEEGQADKGERSREEGEELHRQIQGEAQQREEAKKVVRFSL